MSTEANSSRPPADNPPPVRLVKGQEVSLGCGTLILIALIVSFVGRGGTEDLTREVGELRSGMGQLKKAVEAKTEAIKALQDKLEKTKAKE
jgi:hypothetical protein